MGFDPFQHPVGPRFREARREGVDRDFLRAFDFFEFFDQEFGADFSRLDFGRVERPVVFAEFDFGVAGDDRDALAVRLFDLGSDHRRFDRGRVDRVDVFVQQRVHAVRVSGRKPLSVTGDHLPAENFGRFDEFEFRPHTGLGRFREVDEPDLFLRQFDGFGVGEFFAFFFALGRRHEGGGRVFRVPHQFGEFRAAAARAAFGAFSPGGAATPSAAAVAARTTGRDSGRDDANCDYQKRQSLQHIRSFLGC